MWLIGTNLTCTMWSKGPEGREVRLAARDGQSASPSLDVGAASSVPSSAPESSSAFRSEPHPSVAGRPGAAEASSTNARRDAEDGWRPMPPTFTVRSATPHGRPSLVRQYVTVTFRRLMVEASKPLSRSLLHVHRDASTVGPRAYWANPGMSWTCRRPASRGSECSQGPTPRTPSRRWPRPRRHTWDAAIRMRRIPGRPRQRSPVRFRPAPRSRTIQRRQPPLRSVCADPSST